MQDGAIPTHGKDVAAAAAPHATERSGRAAAHGAPAYPVVVHDGAPVAHGEDVAAAAAPHATDL